MHSNNKKVRIISFDINPIALTSLFEKIAEWIKEKKGRTICVSGVHGCLEAYDNKEFADAHNNADIAIPDGRPIFWSLKLLGYKNAEHLRGEFVTRNLCKYAEEHNFEIGFYGGKKETLEKCVKKLKDKHKKLKINYVYSPPFRKLSEEEDQKVILDINSSQTKILFVALGCPAQETWMASHRDNLKCVCLGVGAAVDYISGNLFIAPRWLQILGLEWFVRLVCEPRRLYKRYISIIFRFIPLFAIQLIKKNH